MARLAPRGKQRTGGALRRLGAGALSFVAALLLLPSINPRALLGRQCGGGDAAAAGVVQPTSPTGTLMGLDGSPGPPAGLTQVGQRLAHSSVRACAGVDPSHRQGPALGRSTIQAL